MVILGPFVGLGKIHQDLIARIGLQYWKYTLIWQKNWNIMFKFKKQTIRHLKSLFLNIIQNFENEKIGHTWNLNFGMDIISKSHIYDLFLGSLKSGTHHKRISKASQRHHNLKQENISLQVQWPDLRIGQDENQV